tara:strand:+ start:2318 stop:3496 length:1179 start_codon:yes stop_codon:yes gene_type:complete
MNFLNLNENASSLVEKWGDHITSKDSSKRTIVARAMERQYQFIQETMRRGNIAAVFKADRDLFPTVNLSENIVPGDIATFTKQSLAMVDMVFEQIVIDQLVDVRTMDGPTAFVHTMAYQQGDAGLYSTGTNFNTGLDPNYADCPSEAEAGCQAGAEVDFQLTATTVTADCKRLQARYTVQAEQDLESQYGDSLADRLRNFMATELRREMQGEVIDQLIANASTTVSWSQTPTGIYTSLDPKIYQETLYDAIQDADNGIFKSADGFRGANWVAGDPDGLLFLEQLNSFNITSDGADRSDSVRGDVDSYSNKFGVANHRYDIWKMRFMPANTLLLGVKSDNPQEVGHIHATYIPVSDLGAFRDPRTACVDMGVMTRYGNATVRPGLFAVVNITA